MKKLRLPEIYIFFREDNDDWEYAYLTMDLMTILYLIPESQTDPHESKLFWEKHKVMEMVQGFNKGKVALSGSQAYLFLDGTDALVKLLKSGDRDFLKKIYDIVSLRSQRFPNTRAFKTYYLSHALKLLKSFRKTFIKDPEMLMLYDLIFERWKQNCSYKEWTEKNAIISVGN